MTQTPLHEHTSLDPPRRRQHTPTWLLALCVALPACDRSTSNEDSTPQATTPLKRVEAAFKGKLTPEPEPSPPPAPTKPSDLPLITAQEFDELMTKIRAETFDDLRAQLALGEAKRHRFTSDQIKGLVSSMPFSQTRIEVAQALYPFAADQERYAQVLGAARFDSEREVLTKWLATIAPSAPATTPTKRATAKTAR